MKNLVLAFGLFVTFFAMYQSDSSATHTVVCTKKCALVKVK